MSQKQCQEWCFSSHAMMKLLSLGLSAFSADLQIDFKQSNSPKQKLPFCSVIFNDCQLLLIAFFLHFTFHSCV